MRHASIPWLGLAGLIAMFALPLLPEWFFEGPRTVRHRPWRHVCADCGGTWTERHHCSRGASSHDSRLVGQLRRSRPAAELEPVPAVGSRTAAVSTTVWHKSTLSGVNGCVEVAWVEGHILVRDSKQPGASALRFTPVEWAAFVEGVRRGEFDLAEP
jgi:Domain of unknown function (DUF397)